MSNLYSKDIKIEHAGMVKNMLRSMRIFNDHPFYDDLLQDGFLGLQRALDTYDPKKSKFSTYAYWLVKNEIQKGISRATDPVISYDNVHTQNKYRAINHIESLDEIELLYRMQAIGIDKPSVQTKDNKINIKCISVPPIYPDEDNDIKEILKIFERIGDIDAIIFVFDKKYRTSYSKQDIAMFKDKINISFPECKNYTGFARKRSFIRRLVRDRLFKIINKNSKVKKFVMEKVGRGIFKTIFKKLK